MVLASNLGFPRIGADRELKRALEAYWQGRLPLDELLATGRTLRLTHWRVQQAAGLDAIPTGDFAWYDHVLETALMLGAVPSRYAPLADRPMDLLFAMARGRQDATLDVPAMEMTKWFDTNYHYIVPEFSQATRFRASTHWSVDPFREATEAGIPARPVLLGPVSFLRLGKGHELDPLSLLESLLPVYAEVLAALHRAGAAWVQIDEPCLVTDLPTEWQAAYRTAYQFLATQPRPQLLLTAPFGALDDHLPLVAALPIEGLHVDLVRAPEQLPAVLAAWPAERLLSLGLIDGRNIWRTDLDAARATLDAVRATRSDGVIAVAPSCSLLHVPVSLASESALDPTIRSWLAGATEKLAEVAALADPTSERSVTLFAETRVARASRRSSPLVHRPAVAARLAAVTEADRARHAPFPARRLAQQDLGLPAFPTTTIGSFPQTAEVRRTRAEHRAGRLDEAAYQQFLRDEIARTIRAQEEIGLDVLVHGESERNDMVEYFGEQLEGYLFTRNGWVQSYGSRCVKPPIILGDVVRRGPMTVAWSTWAQSCTTRPVKGMLTGPVTMLQWSFVRDDQPRSVTCDQLALAIRDEVRDLEAAGLRIIQIDEPALREGLPLRQAAQADYLAWAVAAFRLATAGVADATQIHTHMCYAEFNEILAAVAALDADVISMETSRSRMELLHAFARFAYPNDIGPGVYDIHSPRIPDVEDMVALLHRAAAVIAPHQLWVNPDCGLKTRRWEEVTPALTAMVHAARRLRAEVPPAS